MTVTVQSFRADYPAFADTAAFPDAQVGFWLGFAGQLLDPGRWTTWLDLGTELWMAHNITMEARAIKEQANGDLPGVATGPVNSKSVDKVSIGFDTAQIEEKDGGLYNLTIYGKRFFQMAQMIGAGPVQSGPCFSGYPLSSAFAWQGFYDANIPNQDS